ncbi:hypothetical protein ACGFJ7_35185 [Actinoplanes sp. NPDC048988]|uniref:hypothetical protein n=1 Tax=Actinoplanes sp. NPDC048988 TaxID=3363901 RepID=UPI00370F860A
MTENVIDQTTATTPAEQAPAGEARPAAPEGSVYLSDVLASIRRHASANGWCSTAENITKQALNDGLSFKPVRDTSDGGCSDPSCDICSGQDAVAERFTPAEGVDPLVTKARLKKAIRKACELGYDWDEYRRLYRELIDTYALDQVSLPVTTYTVTFTVTDEQLNGQNADEAGMAYVLRAGIATGFTVATDTTELATPTLRP